MMQARPMVLSPFNRQEALSLMEAAELANRNAETLRRWSARYALGRKVGGRWLVSRPALLMFLAGDAPALAAYHAGDRKAPIVAAYFEKASANVA